MKRIISLIITLVLVVSSSMVYAEAMTIPAEKSKKIIVEINKNKKEIKALDKKAESRMKEIKSIIKKLSSSKKAFDKEQIKSLKDSIAQISNMEKKLKANNEAINRNLEIIKAAKKKKDMELYARAGAEIIEKQRERIKELQSLIKLMDNLKKDALIV